MKTLELKKLGFSTSELTQNEIQCINGGSFSYDLGTFLRWGACVMGGPAGMTVWETQQAALDAMK